MLKVIVFENQTKIKNLLKKFQEFRPSHRQMATLSIYLLILPV